MSLGVVCDDKVAKAKDLLGETEEGVATGGLHKVSKFRGRSRLGPDKFCVAGVRCCMRPRCPPYMLRRVLLSTRVRFFAEREAASATLVRQAFSTSRPSAPKCTA